MAELKNELSWSYSRSRTFGACRRQYYYQYYLKWGGWEAQATAERKLAYRLSKMKSLQSLVGETVHAVIEQILARYKQNHTTLTESEAIASASVRWRKDLDSSARQAWQSNPRATCLMEDYYGGVDRDKVAEDGWNRLETCLLSFFKSNTWTRLQKSRPEHWIAQDGDPFKTATVEGVPMFGRPDLAYRHVSKTGTVACYIFDWKTGRPREADQVQLRYYGLFAQDVWDFSEDEINARLIYLYPNPDEQITSITSAAFADARVAIRKSFDEMKSVLVDVKTNTPMGLDHFPVTTQPWRCHHCAFQEICVDRPGAGDSGPQEDDLID